MKNFFERFIVLTIFIAIAHTFLSDFALYRSWPSVHIRYLLIAGFAIDVIFSIEFFTRTIAAAGKRGDGVLRYWLHERGWVDFLSSLPLLALSSGPAMYIMFFVPDQTAAASLGFINVLKVVKAIRVTRILRLVRIVKIFGRIHNTDSPMAQHHTSYIASGAIFAVIAVLFAFSFVGASHQGIDARMQHYSSLVRTVASIHGSDRRSDEIIRQMLLRDPLVLSAAKGETVLKALADDAAELHSSDSAVEITVTGYRVRLSTADIESAQALVSLQVFCIILALSIVIAFFYARHFAMTITDIIYIISKGMRLRDYNLEVRIPERYRDHEVFRLARYYNDRFLPVKSRKYGDGMQQSVSLSDFMKFTGKQ